MDDTMRGRSHRPTNKGGRPQHNVDTTRSILGQHDVAALCGRDHTSVSRWMAKGYRGSYPPEFDHPAGVWHRSVILAWLRGVGLVDWRTE